MKKIRTKIFAVVLFLFLVMIVIGAAGILFINQLSLSAKGTIQNNYRSIVYTVGMNNKLEEVYNSIIKGESSSDNITAALAELDSNIALDADNITETGEKELVEDLQKEFYTFRGICGSFLYNESTEAQRIKLDDSYENLRSIINIIYDINMDAVYKRNAETNKTAESAIIIMIIFTSVCILLTLPLIIFFPQWIVNPINELNKKIIAISSGKYKQKLDVNRQDEFGELALSFNIMSEKLEEYETSNLESLLSEKKRLDAVIQNLRDGVIILDNNGMIIKMNKIALEVTGLSEKNVINKPAAEIALKNDLFRNILKEVMDKKDGDPKPVKIAVNGELEYFIIEYINTMLNAGSDKENTIGTVILIHNVTAFQKRDAAKTNLIATVSHELKTPISSINLSLRLLDDIRVGELNEEQKKLIYSLRQQSNRLSKVINELLDFSQAETGNIKLNITSVFPEDIIDLSLTALMMIISEKNIKLETQIEDGIPSVKADLEKTVWVLVNIIGNAVRFTPVEGTIILSVKKENGFVKFSIKDEGPGIPESEKNKIFDKFVQVGKPSSGTGLGLAIAKEFVQSQGGRIGVISSPGIGAEFYFLLPVNG